MKRKPKKPKKRVLFIPEFPNQVHVGPGSLPRFDFTPYHYTNVHNNELTEMISVIAQNEVARAMKQYAPKEEENRGVSAVVVGISVAVCLGSLMWIALGG